MNDSVAPELKVAVIGAGGIARNVHLPSLNDMADVSIVAICDLIESRAAALAEKYGIPRVYTLYQEMLTREDLDAVFVLVEPANLFHVVWNCLDAGLDTFMEKPPGITLFQAESLQRKAADAQRILQVGFNRRFIPLVRHVVDQVKARTQINQVQGCFFKFHSGAFDRGSMSAFAADTIHCVDLVRWIAAGSVERVATIVAKNDEPFPSAWNGVCRFDNGVTGIISANYRAGGRVHRFEIHGPGLSAFIDLGFGGPASQAILLAPLGNSQYSLAAGGVDHQGIQRIDGRELAGSSEFHRYYGFLDQDRHFIDCVRTQTPPETSIDDAVKSMQLVDLYTSNAM